MINNQNLEALGQQHKQVWQRLFSILGSAKTGKGDACQELARKPAGERETFVDQVWGRAGLERVRPMLIQIASLEEQVARLEVQMEQEKRSKK